LYQRLHIKNKEHKIFGEIETVVIVIVREQYKTVISTGCDCNNEVSEVSKEVEGFEA